MRQPRAGGPGFDSGMSIPFNERFSKQWIKEDTRPFGTDHHLDLAVVAFGSGIEAASANQSVAGEQRQVQEQLDGVLRQFLCPDHPAKLNPFFSAKHAFEHLLRLMRVDLLAEASTRAEGEPKEFESIRRRARTFGEQLEALVTHFRVLLIREQLDPIVESADGGHQVMAKPGAKQAGEVDRVHMR